MFSEKLVKLRKQAGLSQEQLAEKLNISRQAVSRWENGETLPETAKVIQLGQLFEVSLDYLLTEQTEPAPKREEPLPPETEAPLEPIPVPEPQQANLPHGSERVRRWAGWILTALGSLGYVVIWVLSTMIETLEDYTYVEEGVTWYTVREGYSWGYFIERYRLQALLVVLGVMLALGMVLLLWSRIYAWIESEAEDWPI